MADNKNKYDAEENFEQILRTMRELKSTYLILRSESQHYSALDHHEFGLAYLCISIWKEGISI